MTTFRQFQENGQIPRPTRRSLSKHIDERMAEIATRAAKKAAKEALDGAEAWGRVEELYAGLAGMIDGVEKQVKAEIRGVDERLDGMAGRLEEIKVKPDRVTEDHETRISTLEAQAR